MAAQKPKVVPSLKLKKESTDKSATPDSEESAPKKELSKRERESLESDGSSSDSDSDSDDSSSSSDDDSGSGSDDESGSDESSSEYQEDEDELEQDTADGEALGIDLTRWIKRQEFQFYKDKIEGRIQDLMDAIEEQETRLNDQVRAKGEEYSKGVAIIEAKLDEHMQPVREDMQILLKTRARQESDDMIKQNAIVERFNAIKQEFSGLV